MSLLGAPILEIFTTAEFVGGGYRIIPFVALSMVLLGIYSVVGLQVLRLTHKTGTLAMIVVLGGITNLVLNLIFVPRFGILAAAGTTLLAYIMVAGIALCYSVRQFTFKVDWLSIIKVLSASGVMAAAVLAMNVEGVWQLCLAIGLGAIVYGAVLWLLRGVGKEEVRFLTGLFRRN